MAKTCWIPLPGSGLMGIAVLNLPCGPVFEGHSRVREPVGIRMPVSLHSRRVRELQATDRRHVGSAMAAALLSNNLGRFALRQFKRDFRGVRKCNLTPVLPVLAPRVKMILYRKNRHGRAMKGFHSCFPME